MYQRTHLGLLLVEAVKPRRYRLAPFDLLRPRLYAVGVVAQDEVRGVVLLSLNQSPTENEDGNSGGLAEVIEDPNTDSAIDTIETQQMSDVLISDISKLSEQETIVLSLYYYEEMTLKEIGHTLDISESRVSQIHTKAVGRLRGRMTHHAA